MTKLNGVIKTSNELVGKLEPRNKINVNIIGTGARGLSAYEVWLKEGNIGTVEDFFTSLKGEPGDGSGYIHPASHSANMIDETYERQFISSDEKLRLSGYVHDQISSSNIWHVFHELDKFPSATVVDTGDNVVIGDVEYISNSELKIRFNYEFSGKVYLN